MRVATCLTGFDDREMVNQCLVFGYIINYEPFNFKGRMSDMPDTARYGMQALRLREKLKQYLWEGKFLHTLGATVETANQEVEYIYSVFENDGKKAVAIANQSAEQVLEAVVKPEGALARFWLYEPESSDERSSDGRIRVAPRSLVVLVEQ
jgi:hypothetical protein